MLGGMWLGTTALNYNFSNFLDILTANLAVFSKYILNCIFFFLVLKINLKVRFMLNNTNCSLPLIIIIIIIFF